MTFFLIFSVTSLFYTRKTLSHMALTKTINEIIEKHCQRALSTSSDRNTCVLLKMF